MSEPQAKKDFPVSESGKPTSENGEFLDISDSRLVASLSGRGGFDQLPGRNPHSLFIHSGDSMTESWLGQSPYFNGLTNQTSTHGGPHFDSLGFDFHPLGRGSIDDMFNEKFSIPQSDSPVQDYSPKGSSGSPPPEFPSHRMTPSHIMNLPHSSFKIHQDLTSGPITHSTNNIRPFSHHRLHSAQDSFYADPILMDFSHFNPSQTTYQPPLTAPPSFCSPSMPATYNILPSPHSFVDRSDPNYSNYSPYQQNPNQEHANHIFPTQKSSYTSPYYHPTLINTPNLGATLTPISMQMRSLSMSTADSVPPIDALIPQSSLCISTFASKPSGKSQSSKKTNSSIRKQSSPMVRPVSAGLHSLTASPVRGTGTELSKKEYRKLAERLRREEIKNGYEDIKNVIPGLRVEEVGTPQKVLDKAFLYIQELRHAEDEKSKEIRRLQEEIVNLRQKLNV